MDAKELASMIETWPVEARPHIRIYEGKAYRVLELIGMGCGVFCPSESPLPISLSVDVTCMSGLRWLREQDKSASVKLGNFSKPTITIVPKYGEKRGFVLEFEGPTDLHAIDAAIRAMMQTGV